QNQSELSEMVLELMNSNIMFFTRLIKRGQMDKSIRKDVEAGELSVIILGSIRHLVTVWRLSGFILDLNYSGKKLLRSLELMMAI
ncbi:MAG: hypothetical protein PF693_10780, partial [Spirochaetia bacterium]|nr:hypothetical protein [Spirochaetia bacterium]